MNVNISHGIFITRRNPANETYKREPICRLIVTLAVVNAFTCRNASVMSSTANQPANNADIFMCFYNCPFSSVMHVIRRNVKRYVRSRTSTVLNSLARADDDIFLFISLHCPVGTSFTIETLSRHRITNRRNLKHATFAGIAFKVF